MITIISLFSHELNLNGDAANARVISKRLSWQGVEHEFVEVRTSSDLSTASKLLARSDRRVFFSIGHGSIAAYESLETLRADLRKFVDVAVETGHTGIVVGNSLRWLGFDDSPSANHISEFVTVNLDEKDWPSKAMGYQNSRSQTLALQVKGSVLFTLLHGPFLAKNPEWANELLARLGVEFESNRALLEVDGYVAEIWKLESN